MTIMSFLAMKVNKSACNWCIGAGRVTDDGRENEHPLRPQASLQGHEAPRTGKDAVVRRVADGLGRDGEAHEPYVIRQSEVGARPGRLMDSGRPAPCASISAGTPALGHLAPCGA
jgi:hypothetical protein